MSGHSLSKSKPILLVGAGPASPQLVTKAFAHADSIFAVDGGLDVVQAAGLQAEAVFGDFDSVSVFGRVAKIFLPDQNYTDFQKTLSKVDAPLILCVGFSGGRLDHQLAAFTAILNDHRPIILLDDTTCSFIAPRRLELLVPSGSPVSFYPLSSCRVDIEGVRYPLKDAAMSPKGLISTSNHMTDDLLIVRTMGSGLLTILPAAVVGDVIKALT